MARTLEMERRRQKGKQAPAAEHKSLSVTKRLFSAFRGSSVAATSLGNPSCLAGWMAFRPKKRARASPVQPAPVEKPEPPSVPRPAQAKLIKIDDSDDDASEDSFDIGFVDEYGNTDSALQSQAGSDASLRHPNEISIGSVSVPMPGMRSNVVPPDLQGNSSEESLPPMDSTAGDSRTPDFERGERPRTRGSSASRDQRDVNFTGRRNTTRCKVASCRNCAVEKTQFCYLHERFEDLFDATEVENMAAAGNDNGLIVETRPPPLYAVADVEPPTVYQPALDDMGFYEYKMTCLAITSEGTRCSLLPETRSDFCTIHNHLPVTNSLKQWTVSKGNNIKYKGEPGTTQCRAVTQRKSRCRMQAVTEGDMCYTHILNAPPMCVPIPGYLGTNSPGGDADFHARSPQSHMTYPSDVGTDSSPDSALDASAQEESMPVKRFDHSQDTLYGRSRKEERCIYISGSGKVCPYRAVNESIYCHGHAHMIEALTPVLQEANEDEGVLSDNDSQSGSDSSISDFNDDVASLSSADESNPQPRPYNQREFLKMWKEAEVFSGETTEDVENTRLIRSANQRMCPEDTDGQAKAQYGRLLPRAMRTLMRKIFGLTQNDVFLDIGHGIGNTCLQAAYTTGCEARGIEVVFSRHSIARFFSDNIMKQHRDNPRPRIVGKVELRHGRMEEKDNRDFLTKGITRAYVNNFNGVFAERSVLNKQTWFLDDYVSGIFALMAPGAIMVTLHPLTLGPTRSEANANRRKHGLSEDMNASFYTVEKVLLGKACDTVKWNQLSGNSKNIYVYKYTRLAQPAGDDAVFLCCNPECEHAKESKTIPAVKYIENDRCVVNHCECRFNAYSIRRQRKKDYKKL